MNNAQLVEIPYSPDSSGLAGKLQQLGYPVFLDSCHHNPGGGRFDILSALPAATLRVTAGRWHCTPSLPEPTNGDLFHTAAQLLASVAGSSPGGQRPTPGEMPFSGGLLGFVGYPRLQGHGTWRIEEAFLGVYCWALNVDHKRRRSLIFFHSQCPAGTREAVLDTLGSQADPDCDFRLDKEFDNDMTESRYREAFVRIKEYIDAGDCYQVNLTQRFSTRFSGSPFSAYQRLRITNGKPFSAYMSWDHRALLSLSPERFLKLNDAQVITQPIKGTRPRGRSPEEDRRLAQALLNSEKDRAENLMIVDLLRNDLGAVCEYGSIKVRELFKLQQFDNVFHLVSTISGRLRDEVTGLQLMKNCFPGGSITGAPKLRAMEIIEELEPHRRQVYCGTVLYHDFNGRMDSNLTIRTLFCDQDRIYCWAGGGIVADSEVDQEYAECFDKIQPLINTLND